ncbi:MAG: hypothetical protein ORN50_07150, partial [Crocinitomicaceae bacterium]|nr:hypothetical protein [Crocinitomicaceae bacterium]
LYSKNKQTKKRNKKERHTTKTKTFRRRTHLDLSNRTLKRIPYGGADTDEMVQTDSEEQTRALPMNGVSDKVQETTPIDEEVLPKDGNEEINEEEKPVVVETPNLQTNDVEEESDNYALAQAFKTLAKYVASQIKNSMAVPIVNAAQTQAETEN